MACMRTIHKNACIEGDIRLIAHVAVGDLVVSCVGNPMEGECPDETEEQFCDFDVHQEVCVQIPISFDVTAEVVDQEITCDAFGAGECPEIIVGCTRTIGFFRNHPDVTDALIAVAGGSIVLGIDSQGLSFTATAANATDILSFNVPSPPAPSSPPLAQQYQVLYAQLLAANLNVIAGATCPFATAAIAAANTFLATSPAGGTTGAPGFQDPLAQFNEGNGPGCPGHCAEG